MADRRLSARNRALSELPGRPPGAKVRAGNPWPARIGRAGGALMFAAVAATAWRHAPARAKAPVRMVMDRLGAELQPIRLAILDRIGEPAPDPAASQPGADSLSAPALSSRRKPATSRPDSRTTSRLLNEKGIPMDQEMRQAMDGPALQEGPSQDPNYWTEGAGRVILIAGGLGLFFCLIPWLRSSASKNLT